VKEIRKSVPNWETKPTNLIPALYLGNGRAIIVGFSRPWIWLPANDFYCYLSSRIHRLRNWTWRKFGYSIIWKAVTKLEVEVDCFFCWYFERR
jgi:hypothetical protein